MFFGGGGFPFDFEGARMGGGGPRKEVDNKRFYELLGLTSTASSAEIKKAYRKLAMTHHPDKGGDQETFKNISRAYEVLSDDEKRKVYDQHGEEGLDGSGAGDPMDIFDLFGGGGRRRQQQKRRTADIDFDLKVSLEQLYKGATRKLAVNHDVICSACDGVGGEKDAMATCSDCKGSGIKSKFRQAGPMIQEMRMKCGMCNGEGTTMPESKKCGTCKGEKVMKEKKVLEVYIEPGAPNGHRCVFRGEADQSPGAEAGDVVFKFTQQDHDVFKRKKTHLFIEKDITLVEALSGFKFVLNHLDDRTLLIHNSPGEIITPGSVKCVPHEGMPVKGNRYVRGDLFVVFNVLFPAPGELNAKTLASLNKLLPSPKPLMVDESSADVEHHHVTDHTPEEREQAGHRGGEVYDEDEEGGGHEGGGQRVQCHQQ